MKKRIIHYALDTWHEHLACGKKTGTLSARMIEKVTCKTCRRCVTPKVTPKFRRGTAGGDEFLDNQRKGI